MMDIKIFQIQIVMEPRVGHVAKGSYVFNDGSFSR